MLVDVNPSSFCKGFLVLIGWIDVFLRKIFIHATN